MSVDDRQLNIRVEQQLVRRGIDTSKLNVSTTKGSVTIQGFLKPRSRRYEIKQSMEMKQLDRHLRRIPNVKDVHWRLENWRKEGTKWTFVRSASESKGKSE